MNLEVTLRMCARRANLRGLSPHHDVSAVTAFPNFYFTLLEHFLRLHIFQQGTIAFFMVLFNVSHQTELRRQFLKAFFFGSLGKASVHIRPLVVLTVSGILQVGGGIADALQLLEPHLGVLFLVVSGLQEEGCDLLEAFLLGLGGKVGVLVPGLGLTGKSRLQILLRLGTCVFAHLAYLLKYNSHIRVLSSTQTGKNPACNQMSLS